jgi:hypothetical protein
VLIFSSHGFEEKVRRSNSAAIWPKHGPILAAGLIAAGLALFCECGCSRRYSEDGRLGFSEQPVKVNDYYLFDMGIVDADGDGNLDIYTSNHIALQSLLLGDGRGNFRDVCQDWGLSHQKEFPGLEDAWTSPAIEGEGVYVYWHKRRVIIRASLRDAAFVTSGKLVLDSPVEVETRTNWTCRVGEVSSAQNRTRTEVDFGLGAKSKDGLLALKPELIAVPLTFTLSASVPLDRIFIGAGKKHPRVRAFELSLKDRHGMAWADWNGDGRLDVFIAQGGVSGRTADYPEIYPYELFAGTGSGLVDVTPRGELKKCEARPRQVAWVDVDGDNLLDLFVYGAWSRNQLFRQLPGNRFVDLTEESGLLTTENGLSSWFDADGDGDADLFVAARDVFALYRNDKGHFQKTIVGVSPGAGGGAEPEYRRFGHPAVADFDGDGDFDIYVASPRGSAMLINEGGHFVMKDPAAFGLPSRAVTANWVDADNDSLPDLHTVPDGLFCQSAGGRFKRTGMLASDKCADVASARCNWFDADNDGDRDVLVSLLDRQGEEAKAWSSKFYINSGTKNHWLEIHVTGPPGNRDAVGARVVVELRNGRRLAQQVGFSDGSHYSQGHYRLYFGLGHDRRPRSVSILWPDGATQRIDHPGSDRLITCGRGSP